MIDRQDPTGDGCTMPIRQWLAEFAAAVRARDFVRGRDLFDPDVVAFGSRAHAVVGIDALMSQQWQGVWDRTRGFDFEPEGSHIGVVEPLAWAAVTWQSQGWSDEAGGHWFARRGRASFVFRKAADRWLAVHSHFSMQPALPVLALPPTIKSD